MSSNQAEHREDSEGFDAVELQAADWVVKQDQGLTPQQEREFAAWLSADERHAEVFAELVETWGRIGELREPVTPPVAMPVATTGVERGSGRPARSGKIIWLSAVPAAAAAIAFFSIITWRPTDSAEPFAMTAATEVGGLRKLALPDGSVVQLNTDSAVAVQFSKETRRVQLVRGEAHFQVTKNPSRPFIVSASAVAVRAVGTAFDVRLRPESVEVLVTEGRVRVNDSVKGHSLLASPATGDSEPLLVAGQRAVVSLATAVVTAPAAVVAVAPVEMGQALAWQSRRLEFVATPLAAIVAEFNRYNRHKLVIADARLATRRFGGTFSAGDCEELVRLLEADFGVVAERGPDETKLRLAP